MKRKARRACKPFSVPDEEIARRARCGWTVRAIARDIGEHPATVARRIKRLGIKRYRNKRDARTVPYDVQLRARELYRDGAGLLEVARAMGLKSATTAAKVMRAGGETIRPSGGAPGRGRPKREAK